MHDTAVKSMPLLHLALLVDTATGGASGLLLAAAAGPLSALLGLPEPLLRVAGLILLPYAALAAWLGTRAAPSRNAVDAIVAVNVAWVADSLGLLALGPALAGPAPTALGVAFVLAQAAVVAGFAAAQRVALRRAEMSEAPHAFA